MNTEIKKNYESTKKVLQTLEKVDLLVVGAGVGGLEVAYQLGNKWKNGKTIMVADQADYVGGRVRTVNDTFKGKKISYEAGAARFNDNHNSLLSVISRCGLKKNIVKIPSFWEFRPTEQYKKAAAKMPYKDVEELLKKLVDHYKHPKHAKYLQTVTLYEACRDLFGQKTADFLKHSYSYYSEIKVFNGNNAIRSLNNDLSEQNQFYMLGGGLAQIPICQANQYIKTGTNKNRMLALKTQVRSWKYDKLEDCFVVNLFNFETEKSYKIKVVNLVLATNGKEIRRWRESLRTISPKILDVISHVTSEPLLRTYAIYESKWFKKYGKVVTDGLVKYIIPINPDIGLIMISYTDGEYVRKMMRHIQAGTQEEAIYKSLKEIFPDDKIEKKPQYLRNEYWETGAVYWNRGADSDKMSKFMMHPSKKYNLFITGDSFSENQAWTDGAIYNALQVSKKIN